MLLLLIAGMTLCGQLLLATQSAVIWWLCMSGVLLAIIVRCVRQDGSTGGASRYQRPLLFIGLVVLVLAIASAHRESSYDGLNYHIVLSLRAAMFLGHVDTLPLAGQHWTDAYPKAFEYFAASAYLLTGKFNSGKAFNLLLAIALSFYVFHYFRFLYPKRRALMLTALVAFNPVVLQQLFTLYVDAAHYLCWMLVLFSGMLAIQGVRSSFVVTLCASCLLVSSKFTGPVFLAITAVIAAVFFWRQLWSKQGKQWVVASALGAVIGMTVVGASPYVTNVMSGKHIFSPIMGKDKVDIMTTQTRPEFEAQSRGHKIFVSWFYPPQSGHAQSPNPVGYTKVDISSLGQSDPRIGAFGPLFPLMLILSLVIAVRARHVFLGTWLLLLCTVATVIVHPEGWWARYVPLPYLIPLIVALPRPGELLSKFQKTLYALIIVNGLIVFAAVALHELSAWNVYRFQVAQAMKCGEPVYVRANVANHAMNLYDDGIKVRAASASRSGGACDGVFEDIDVSQQRLSARLRALFQKP